MVEDVFTCQKCHNFAKGGKQIANCNHYFCNDCLAGRENKKRQIGEICFQCRTTIQGFNKDFLGIQTLEKYEEFKPLINNIVRQHVEVCKLWDQSQNYPGDTKVENKKSKEKGFTSAGSTKVPPPY